LTSILGSSREKSNTAVGTASMIFDELRTLPRGPGFPMPTYSENGYGNAVEKASDTKGWSFPVFEELWNYGFPQEITHFGRCVRGKEEPQATGKDGLVVMEALCAGYASAGEGRKVSMPFRTRGVRRPVDLWLQGSGAQTVAPG
jgi:Oxidoreductase family, C-terminal alpha/beta domain